MIYGGIRWDQFVRLAISATEILINLKMDLVVANNNIVIYYDIIICILYLSICSLQVVTESYPQVLVSMTYSSTCQVDVSIIKTPFPCQHHPYLYIYRGGFQNIIIFCKCRCCGDLLVQCGNVCIYLHLKFICHFRDQSVR